jgi:hypothetical protein
MDETGDLAIKVRSAYGHLGAVAINSQVHFCATIFKEMAGVSGEVQW